MHESTLARGKVAMAIESTIERRDGVVTRTTEARVEMNAKVMNKKQSYKIQ